MSAAYCVNRLFKLRNNCADEVQLDVTLDDVPDVPQLPVLLDVQNAAIILEDVPDVQTILVEATGNWQLILIRFSPLYCGPVVCPEPPESPVCPEPPESPVCPEPPARSCQSSLPARSCQSRLSRRRCQSRPPVRSRQSRSSVQRCLYVQWRSLR